MDEHGPHHAHGAGHHPHHGGVVHAPSTDATEAYRTAFEAAQPDAGKSVIPIELEAREMDWPIAPGATFRAWGFNGQIPGPTIEGRVGDVLQVRFTNHLPEATTIHWHGLRVPAPMDGTDMVQRPVEPEESFTYRFRLPDAGMFWYHPHLNETVQMERGRGVVRSRGGLASRQGGITACVRARRRPLRGRGSCRKLPRQRDS